MFVLGSCKEKGKVFAQWRDTYSDGCFGHRLRRSWDIVSCLIMEAVSSPTLFARCYVCWLCSAVFTSNWCLQTYQIAHESFRLFVMHCTLSVNHLTPNDPYMGRTAPLTSKRYILYIYSTNIGTEYFKNALYSPFFSLQNAVCFIMLTCLVPVLFTFYIQGVLKFKKIIPAPKG